MEKKITLFCISFLLTICLYGQHSPIICGNEIFSTIVKEKYPALFDSFNSTFEEVHTTQRNSGNEPLTVNVVVHVIWKEDVENLDDSIINNQIRILNEDYNRLNKDTANLRSIFKPEAGNANIHFNLAQIVRVNTDKEFSVDLLGTNLLAEVKHDADGGSDAWNPNEYLNIWVCKIQPITILGFTVGQILGFAFPPNNLENWPADSGAPTAGEDGVVIDFRSFGSNNPNIIENPDGSGPLTINGRTPVHEVGHYFGLRHIWGDGGLLGPNDCAQSDGIDDTPYADSQSAFDCDTTKNSCTQIETFYNADVPDLIENYMDYSSETCMNMFTQQQVEIMRNVLQGPRSGLVNTVSGIETNPNVSVFNIYPNPAKDFITISLKDQDLAPIDIRIVSLNGQLLQHNSIGQNNSGEQYYHIDLPNLETGIYFLVVKTKRGINSEKLFVIR
jgi:hypothetical protein